MEHECILVVLDPRLVLERFHPDGRRGRRPAKAGDGPGLREIASPLAPSPFGDGE